MPRVLHDTTTYVVSQWGLKEPSSVALVIALRALSHLVCGHCELGTAGGAHCVWNRQRQEEVLKCQSVERPSPCIAQ